MRGTWLKALGIFLGISLCVQAQTGQSPYQAFTSMLGPNFYGNFSGNFLGAGARSIGMGQAFYAVSDDISAVTWNPAGLVGHEKPILGASFGSLRPRGSYVDAGPLSLARNQDFIEKQAGSLSNLDFLGFLSPIRIRGHQFVFSGAYSRQFEDYSSLYTTFSGQQPYWDQYGPFPDSLFDYNLVGTVKQRATPYAVNFGFGTRFYKTVDIGFAINVYTGKQYNVTTILTNVPSFNAPNLLGNQTVVADQQINMLDTFKFSGVNFTLGAKGTAGKFSYAALVKSGFDLNVKGGLTFSDTVKYNGRTQSDLTYTIFADNQLIKLSIPWTLAGGVAYKAKENLLLAADLEYRPYSGKMVNRRDSTRIRAGTNNEEFFTTIDPGWFNCVALRTGAEYLWKTNSRVFPTVPLRAGLGYTQVPAASYDRTGGTESDAQFNLSAGAGVYWQQIHLDVAYSFTSLNRDVLTGYYVGQYVFPVISFGQLKTRNHSVSATFTGYF